MNKKTTIIFGAGPAGSTAMAAVDSIVKGITTYCHTNKNIIIVALLALMIRLIIFFAIKPWDPAVVQNRILVSDAVYYQELALGILSSGNFHDFWIFRTPGFPVFAALIYFLVGIKLWVVLLAQVFINVIAGLLVYTIGKELFNRQIAIVAAGIFFFDPHVILYSLSFLSDTLFVALFVGTIAAFIIGLKRNRVGCFVAGGFLLGIAALTKPIIQFFPVVVLVLLLCARTITVKKKAIYFIGFTTVFLLIIFPWLWRNYTSYQYFGLSNVGDYHIMMLAHMTERQKAERPEAIREGKDKQEFDGRFLSRQQEKKAYDYIKSNIPSFIKSYAQGTLFMYIHISTKEITTLLGLKSTSLPGDVSVVKKAKAFFRTKSMHEFVMGMAVGLYLLVCYCMFLYGSFLMIREREYFTLLMIILILLYFTVLTGGVGLSRYKMPGMPFYALISGKGIVAMVRHVGRMYAR